MVAPILIVAIVIVLGAVVSISRKSNDIDYCTLWGKDDYWCDGDWGDKDGDWGDKDGGGKSYRDKGVWTDETIGGMSVSSVLPDGASSYDKVVIMCHGGGGSGQDWEWFYQNDWFGDVTGMKFVFPTSPLSGLWYYSTKDPACGLDDACSYDASSITTVSDALKTLIDQEKSNLGNDGSKIFIAGYSQGGQIATYMQIAKLDYALGGVGSIAGYSLPPLGQMQFQSQSDARAAASYYGSDMRWFNWSGANDPIFPATQTQAMIRGMLTNLGVSGTLVYDTIQSGAGHDLTQNNLGDWGDFVRSGRRLRLRNQDLFLQ